MFVFLEMVIIYPLASCHLLMNYQSLGYSAHKQMQKLDIRLKNGFNIRDQILLKTYAHLSPSCRQMDAMPNS